MSDPITATGVGGAAGWKLLGGAAGAGAIGAGLASIVVMCITTPRSPKEWAVGLVSTVVGSIGGGSAVIMKFGLQSWAHDPFGLVAMLGLVFSCGLPAWSIVRWAFNWIEKRKDKDLAEVVQDARDAMVGAKNG
ncbi:type IV secretory pathway TrbD component [Cupriavidus metallidurans]